MAAYPGSLSRPMQDWRDAVWRAVPEGAEPERFAARRAFLLDARGGRRARARPRLRRRRLRRRAARRRLRGDDGRRRRARRCGAPARGRPGAEAVALVEGAPLPFAEDAFDVVWAGEVLEHVADVVGLLAEVRRVLRWGGTAARDDAVARARGRRHRRALRSARRPPALLQRADPARGARRRGLRVGAACGAPGRGLHARAS